MTKKLRVTVEGKTYDVQVEILGESGVAAAPVVPLVPVQSAPVVAPAAPAPAPAAAAAPAAEGDVPSPLAGKVVSIDCAVGQKVEAGQKIVTLEAMKMNTFVTAPGAGTVAAIKITAGQAVEEGQALVTLS